MALSPKATLYTLQEIFNDIFNDTTHSISGGSGGGAGTQYADGTTAATPTGTEINWNDAGVQRAVSASKPLPVSAVGNVASGATDSGNPVKVAGKYNASAITLTDGQRGDLQLDSNGNFKVNMAAALAGEDLANDVLKVEQRFTNTRCTADTLVKTGVGQLHALIISQPASATPTAGVLTVYDNSAESGAVIFQHYLPASAIATPVTITLNAGLSVGCYVGFDATLAGIAVNVEYR